MNVLKAKVDGQWVPVSGPAGPGLMPGGTTGQVLTKKSASDYDTQWTTPLSGILANNASLQSYKADGVAIQNIVKVGTDNNIHFGTDLPINQTLIIGPGAPNFITVNIKSPLRLESDVSMNHPDGRLYQTKHGGGIQFLLQLDTSDNILLGDGLLATKRILIPGGTDMWFGARMPDLTIRHIASHDTTAVYLVHAPPVNLNIGFNALGDINIGNGIAAGKVVNVPSLVVGGQLSIWGEQWLRSTSGALIAYHSVSASTLYYAHNMNSIFNNDAGSTTFVRDVRIMGNLHTDYSILKGGVAYIHPDFVFEHHYTGRIETFANAPGAKDYDGLLSLRDVEDYVRENWRLPHHVRDGKYDLFRRGDEVLAEIERLYLYLFEHESRLAALEKS